MNISKLTYLFGMLLLFSSCCEENMTSENPTLRPEGLSLRYKVDGEMELVRSVNAMSHEKSLYRVHLMFFDMEDSEQFVAYTSVDVTPGRNTFTLDPPTTLSLDHSYKVLAVGNGDCFSADGKSLNNWLAGFVGDYSDMMSKLKAYNDGAFTRNMPGQLPFFAKFTDKNGEESTFTVVKDGENTKVVEGETSEFIFSRAVCRFDIHNLVGHLLDVRFARVVNSPDAGYYFYDGVRGGDIPDYVPQEATSGEGYMPVTSEMEPGINTTQRLEGSLYGFPNVVNTSVVNDGTTSALMLAGYYTDPETGVKDSELTYYRFNMANLGESQVLNRNFCYRATIKGVRRRGALTEREAYNDASPIFLYDFSPAWNTDDDNVASDKDGNFLVVNKTHLTFQGDASDVDFVELHVSTNPELQWDVEWVANPGHNNDKFTFQKISDSAVKCGPLESNPEPYLRYGYINIVGTNPLTGVKLSIPVYLMQLSIQQNVKCLTVNGETGTFTQNLDPMGGEISFKVITGSKLNNWKVVDDGGLFKNWDLEGVDFTQAGGNNGILTISAPANISGKTRTASLIVSLVENDMDENGEKRVRDVAINLIQETSSQLLEVYNAPASSNGVLDIECLDLNDFDNPNGVVNPKNFIVKLTDPTNLRYRVWTDFDKDRDAVLSITYHRAPGTAHPDGEAKATHPENANGTPKFNKNDKYEGLTNGTQFWLNPFRTGPDDPRITGTVHVEAYNIKNSSIKQEIAFTVRLNSQPVEIADCILKDSDGTYFLWPDRNVGATSLIQSDREVKSVYSDSRKKVYITRPTGAQPWEISGFEGVAYKTSFTWGVSAGKVTNFSGNINANIIKAQRVWIQDNAIYKEWYGQGENEINKWSGLTKSQADVVTSRTISSKSRPFTVSVISYNDLPVCCWIQQNDYGVNYVTSNFGYGQNANAYCPLLKYDGESFAVEYVKKGTGTTSYAIEGSKARLVRSMSNADITSYRNKYLGRIRK